MTVCHQPHHQQIYIEYILCAGHCTNLRQVFLSTLKDDKIWLKESKSVLVYLFIHSFHSPYYLPNTVPSVWHLEVNRIDMVSAFMEPGILLGILQILPPLI